MKKVRGEYKNKQEKEWATRNLHKKILSLIPEGKGKALDLGCGSGFLASQLSNKGYMVLGVDIENFTRYPIKFLKRDLDKPFEFNRSKFDLITAVEIIEHLENPRKFIREIKKCLKKEGIAIITTPNILNWKARLYYLLKGIIWGFRKEDYKISGHISPVTRYDFQRICDEEKLKILQITYNNSNKEIFGDNLIVIIEK